jgi:hypothetical protein
MSKIKFLVEIDSKYVTEESIKASLASQFMNVKHVDFLEDIHSNKKTIGIKLTRKEKTMLSDIIIQTISRCFNGGESVEYKADLEKLNNKILGKKAKK